MARRRQVGGVMGLTLKYHTLCGIRGYGDHRQGRGQEALRIPRHPDGREGPSQVPGASRAGRDCEDDGGAEVRGHGTGKAWRGVLGRGTRAATPRQEQALHHRENPGARRPRRRALAATCVHGARDPAGGPDEPGSGREVASLLDPVVRRRSCTGAPWARR